MWRSLRMESTDHWLFQHMPGGTLSVRFSFT